jgi:hypothetical protein
MNVLLHYLKIILKEHNFNISNAKIQVMTFKGCVHIAAKVHIGNPSIVIQQIKNSTTWNAVFCV